MNSFLVIVACLAIVVGVLVFVRVLRSKKYQGDPEQLEYKGDLPILPRDQRPSSSAQISVPQPSDSVADSNTVDGDTSGVGIDVNSTDLAEPKTATANTPVQPAQNSHALSGAGLMKKNDNLTEKFEQNSPIIDDVLTQTREYDRNNDPLLNAKDGVTIIITPRNQAGVSGRKVLDIVRSYELRYGVKSLYHRYEQKDGTGDLWFSMLGVTHEGMRGFDLNVLVESHFLGLALFLSLPNPNALRGFNIMVSTARMIAKDLDADIHDEHDYLFDEAYLQKMYLKVKNYPVV